ncbi:MAG: hypothetical protein ABSH47_13470 [Bryobacteraceae bacterium]|jgi:hypothetical protein
MRSSGWLVFASLIVVSCFAQQPGRPYPVYTGFGPTGFAAPPGALSGTSFGAPFGTVRQGMGYGRGNNGGGHGGGYARRGLVAPIYVAVPVYGGYGYGPDYVDAPPPVQAAPTVIINQNFVPDHANPVVREVPDTPDSSGQDAVGSFQAPGPPPVEPSPSDADQPTIYLIAFRDHSIVPALAYWTEGGMLKYVNMDHGLNQATLDLVDRDMSRLLNQQRNVEFRLPAR